MRILLRGRNQITPFGRPANYRNYALSQDYPSEHRYQKNRPWRDDSCTDINRRGRPKRWRLQFSIDGRTGRGQHKYANDASISTVIVELLEPETHHDVRTLLPEFTAFVGGNSIRDPTKILYIIYYLNTILSFFNEILNKLKYTKK